MSFCICTTPHACKYTNTHVRTYHANGTTPSLPPFFLLWRQGWTPRKRESPSVQRDVPGNPTAPGPFPHGQEAPAAAGRGASLASCTRAACLISAPPRLLLSGIPGSAREGVPAVSQSRSQLSHCTPVALFSPSSYAHSGFQVPLSFRDNGYLQICFLLSLLFSDDFLEEGGLYASILNLDTSSLLFSRAIL